MGDRPSSMTKIEIGPKIEMRSSGKWVSEIREPRKKLRIFATAELAARAHDVATIAIKGRAGHLNFPDLAHLLPRPASAAHKDVQEAAILAASADFPHCGSQDSSSASPPPLPPAYDALFDDLPDLLLDLRYESSPGLACASSWVVDDDIAGGGLFRLEEPLLWEY